MKRCLEVHEIHYISVLEGVVSPLPFSIFTSIVIPGGLVVANMFDDSPSSGKDLSASSASWSGTMV